MKTPYAINRPQFFTATVLGWKHLLSNDKYKDIIADAIRFAVINKRITLSAFVIMSNHIHLAWQQLFPYTPSGVQLGFMKYTAQSIKFDMQRTNTSLLEEFQVNSKDRQYQIWKRRPLSVELFTPKAFQQKIDYIHNNPVRAGLCKFPEEYKYSSALYYENGIDTFSLFT